MNWTSNYGMSITIVIPSYWGWESGQARQAGDAVYDHPTPLDTDGLLGRCLDSLKNISGPEFNVMVITVATNTALETKTEAKIDSIIRPFRASFPICQYGPSELRKTRERLSALNFDPELLGLDNYSRVRNCQLLAAHVLGSDVIVAIDDDEVINDPDFLNKALQVLGQTKDGKHIDGLAGIYLDKDGSSRLLECNSERQEKNLFKRKAAIQNDGHSTVEARAGDLVETPIALGGNMVFSRPLFEAVSFDPWISRGEDIDYVLNSRLHCYNWFLHKGLYITHLPPAAGSSDAEIAYSKLQQDIVRFLYSREKLLLAAAHKELYPVKAEDFDPYPGWFLRPELESHALEVLKDLRPQGLNKRVFPEPEIILERALQHVCESANKYFDFAKTWPQLMAVLSKEQVLRDTMRRLMGI